jgi:hypothetical protein
LQQSLGFFESDDGFRSKLASKLRHLAEAGLFLGGSLLAKAVLSSTKSVSVCVQSSRGRLPHRPSLKSPAGTLNPGFLNADFFRTQFLDLLQPYRDRVAVILFEFGVGIEKLFDSPIEFAEKLDLFFSQLAREFRFAVEICAPDLLAPAYFEALHKHGVAHVFNAWSGMPEVSEQMSTPGSFSAPFTVARALLRKGRLYEESVNRFAPYNELKETNIEVRAALRDLLVRAKRRAEPTFIFVNNRLEGFAPGTIAAIIDEL